MLQFDVEIKGTGRLRRWMAPALVLLAFLLVNGVGFVFFPPRWVVEHLPAPAGEVMVVGRQGIYSRWVALQQAWELARLPAAYLREASPRTILYFPPGQEVAARQAAGLVERFLDRLAADAGVRPRGPISLVILPSRQALAGALGERYDNAVGAYWRGVIWVLAPDQWLDTGAPGWEETFATEGPVVHELAHYLLDQKTGGNLPAWFDEGVAQYEEYRVTGFQWVESANRLDQPLYGLRELTRDFVRLPNEPLAYRQSFLLVRFLAEAHGEPAIWRIADALARGLPAEQAVGRVTGSDYRALEPRWRSWLAALVGGATGAAGVTGAAGL